MAGVVARVVALLAAVGMVVLGLTLRANGDSQPGDGPTDPSSTHSDVAASGPVAILCGRSLAEVCQAASQALATGADGVEVDLTIVDDGDPAGVSLDRPVFAASHVVADAVAAAERRGERPAGAIQEPLAGSSLVVAGRADRVAAFERLCPQHGAQCLASLIGTTWDEQGESAAWGRVSVAFADASRDPLTGLFLGTIVHDATGSLDTAALDATAALLDRVVGGATVDTRTSANRLTPMVTTPALTDFRVGLAAEWAGVSGLPRAAGLSAVALSPDWAYLVGWWQPTEGNGQADSFAQALTSVLRAQLWDDPATLAAPPSEPAGAWEAVHRRWLTLN